MEDCPVSQNSKNNRASEFFCELVEAVALALVSGMVSVAQRMFLTHRATQAECFGHVNGLTMTIWQL